MTTAEQAKAKYDQLADRYEEIFFYVADLGERLVDFARPPREARTLDVGAGRGAVARAALAAGCAVTAIDASPRMVERLVADHPEITGRTMDAARLEFPDSSFDLVTAGFVVQILADPAGALAEAHRVLAPGGTIALSLETQGMGRMTWLQDLSTEFFAAAQSAEPTEPSDPTEDTEDTATGPMTHQHLDALLEAAGFTGLAQRSVAMPLTIPDPPALWDWLIPRGLAEAVAVLPPERAELFHQRFLAEAGRMHEEGGIILDFAATLHRAERR
ncbi:class I SAM-dependent methyltransferase [Amycolatopsis nigrescens]|uniref:class I SAM-dependent methyltransferase n=1 Tax=Amycolatopsis nigrescens TaxID=381445 RepID=UPI00036871DD|nr:class I SAM-dependent methyltransferase [Amycolatopsis nigrescens]